MNICVVGLGYIGLPSAGFFAEKGFQVHGMDVNKKVVETLKEGSVHIEEPGLPDLINKVVKSGQLTVSDSVVPSDVFIISVPTPIYENQTADLDYVKSATESVLPYLTKGNIVVIESTIPPRTIDDIVVPIIKEYGFDPDANEIYVAHCPERVIPGNILNELEENNRIVGGYTEEASRKAAEIYRQAVSGDVFETKAITAEMAKLMENTFRDVNIALANELAKVSSKLEVNAHDVISLANMHPRVNIHQPGPGVGGHCLAVDPYFIIEKAQAETPLIQTSREINESMPSFVVEQVKKILQYKDNPKIAALGLAYKGNVDDLRESPAITIVEKLAEQFEVKCHDPFVKEDMTHLKLHSLEEALDGSDIALILTDHNVFKDLGAGVFTTHLSQPYILDTKNCLPAQEGLTIYRIGDLSKVNPIE
ncbi:UDP-N-acetyl-D-mannosaminuronic acid dehydrogenase [Thalassobacillus cyri]|uniref:UDP-N-acetyl-D-mannosaminuronic acid dehydrogenase n=1 Tax=Thalassobacillus cyri TaxID=571932 RepID=A0A1H4DW08_9BACI|nr:nucleotide sugar dehydrogenase [Thalassobacillus cyri]SEA76698.1 UDP-N-acetyl-D-mannosaminuronic acid dehydrogenase [Thalassobacillus cyri]